MWYRLYTNTNLQRNWYFQLLEKILKAKNVKMLCLSSIIRVSTTSHTNIVTQHNNTFRFQTCDKAMRSRFVLLAKKRLFLSFELKPNILFCSAFMLIIGFPVPRCCSNFRYWFFKVSFWYEIGNFSTLPQILKISLSKEVKWHIRRKNV